MSSSCRYSFGAFEAHAGTRELYKHGVKLKLRPQPFQVLQVLLDRPGEVVTREELQQMLWSSDTFVDFEHGLNTSIKELRGALSDSASEPRYIETLPKIGYRLMVPVSRVSAMEAAAAVGEAPAVASVESIQAAQEIRQPEAGVVQANPPIVTGRRYGWFIVGAALVLLLATIGFWRWQRTRTRAQVPPQRQMLAVLPFENLTGDSQQEYFSDGLTEEMISQIGNMNPQSLGVIARTSAMHYKHTQEALDQIGRELGVNYILEGSVRRDGDRVRISAQLIQVKDQSHVWAKEYDRELRQLLRLQSEIAQQAAGEIQLTLGGHRIVAVRPSPSAETSFEAYDLYLKGLYFLNQRSGPGFDKTADYFKQAIHQDPNYARAYGALANTYGLMDIWSLRPAKEAIPQARAAALKALQLDPSVAEAHTSLALIAERYDYDWNAAEKEFRLAIQLDPSYATAHQWYGEYLSFQGRFDEALAESERARQLDPMSLIIARDDAFILFRARQYDRAIAEGRSVLERDPNFRAACGFLILPYAKTGKFSEALEVLNRDLLPSDRKERNIDEAVIYALWNRPARARLAVEKLEHCSRCGKVYPQDLLRAYVAVGRNDDAIAQLELMYAERSPMITILKTDPFFDPLRGDLRFQAFLQKVGLAQ
ncbi:MAG: winged helix-turn-helix domain-containing protein [Acidobacteria bacterium]|nr:winged helix-turn-helix domain-containing protein [Acidobacteriota bacterium]